MPISKRKIVLNAFSPSAASQAVGMSVHMLNYLAREGYLIPTYGRTGKRGKTRYYSYRDLVIARVFQRLLDAGLELARLKRGLSDLQKNPLWTSDELDGALRMLVTDGKDLYFVQKDGRLLDLTTNGQLTFAFVLDVSKAKDEVRDQLSEDQLKYFTLENRRRLFG